jgi:hypothetical protein
MMIFFFRIVCVYGLNFCENNLSRQFFGLQVACTTIGRDEAGAGWNCGVEDDKGELQGIT